MKTYSSKLTIPTPVCCICQIPAVVIDIFVEKFKRNFEKRGKKRGCPHTWEFQLRIWATDVVTVKRYS